MSQRSIKWMNPPAEPRVPNDVEGIRKALLDALERIDALEDELARLRGEKPARAGDGEER